MSENSTRVRHAVSRSTGATTWTRKDADEWRTTCLNHGGETTEKSRGLAWKNGSTPALFCPKCKAIAAGKAPKITEGRLDLPTPTSEGRTGKPKSPGKATEEAAAPVKKPTGKPVAKKSAK